MDELVERKYKYDIKVFRGRREYATISFGMFRNTPRGWSSVGSECTLNWETVGIGPILEMYDDSWYMFKEFPELFADLASLEKANDPWTDGIDNVAPEIIISILEKNGFTIMA